jgi:hypothetical protein
LFCVPIDLLEKFSNYFPFVPAAWHGREPRRQRSTLDRSPTILFCSGTIAFCMSMAISKQRVFAAFLAGVCREISEGGRVFVEGSRDAFDV